MFSPVSRGAAIPRRTRRGSDRIHRAQEEFDRVFSLNTRGQFFVAREAYRHLNEGGRIILMSSNTAKDFSVPKHSLYSGSKGAIDSFVRVFAKDCGHKKITVNAVAPGGTVTDMFNEVSQHYIPNGEKYTAEERQQVSSVFLGQHFESEGHADTG